MHLPMRPTVVSRSPSVERVRAIPIRRPTFDFSRDTPAHWFGGDPFLSHLANAMSLTFPEGERFFIDSVRRYEERVDSPALRQDIARFHGQEALHSRAHEVYNRWLETIGLDVAAVEESIRQGLDEVRRNRSPRYQLAMTCALEHFTAMMAELLLSTDEMRDAMAPEVRRLLVWHAIEEIEHKAVAFDTYVATGGTYGTRVLAMLVTTFGFTASVAAIQLALMRQDPGAKGLRLKLRGLRKIWLSPGWFRRLIPAYVDYFRRDFHPWDREPPAHIDAFRRDLESSVVRA